MLTDGQGLEVSTDNPDTVAALDHFTEQALFYGNEMGQLFKAQAAEPDNVLLNVWTAILHLGLETGDGPEQAAPFVKAAAQHLASANEREKLWFAAIASWMRGDMEKAVIAHEAIAERYPRDMLNVKLLQTHYFNLGDLEALLAVSEKTLPANEDNRYAWGCYAFGLEEANRLGEAETAAQRSLEMDRADPWAHHALAHVMEARGKLEEGIAFMEEHADVWQRCNSFMLTHNWWHVALYNIDRDDTDRALKLYDERVWGVWKEFSQDQVGAVSLLARLEMRGVDVGNRWDDVGSYLQGRLHEHVQPFLDLQYLYGLAKAGHEDAAREMLGSLERHAMTCDPYVRPAWEKVALPAARGVLAHAFEDWVVAATQLGRAVPMMREIGGSHAQRDLFEQLYLDALMQAGWADKAMAILNRRDAHRHNIPWVHRAKADMYRQMGMAEAAAGEADIAADYARAHGAA